MALIHPVLVASTLFLHTSPPIEGKYAVGTGFMMARPDTYNYVSPEAHDFKRAVEDRWRVWIVTAAHNVPDDAHMSVVVETNLSSPAGGKARWAIPAGKWFKHPKHPKHPDDPKEYDVAITPALTQAPQWNEMEPTYWLAHWHLSRESMNRHGIVEGDKVYIMGFPLQWGTGRRNNPIVRHGIIAQVQPYLRGEGNRILIDGAIWGGNSGGPVATEPAALALKGTQAYTKTSLVGMVVATNVGKGLPAGIGIVVPTEIINQTIDLYLRQESAASDS